MSEQTPLKRYISPVEFAELFHTTQRHVRVLLQSGQLPHIRLGRLWRIDLHAVEQMRRGPTLEQDTK